MAVLNSWQKISRVIPGKPFGDGSDGAYSSATIPTMTKQSCSGAADQTDLVIAGAAFSDNDVILIIQMRGTGVGQWEVNKIASGGGTTTLVMQQNLHYTYTDSGNSQAQVTKIPQYTNVTVQAGTWNVPAWNENVGGILTFACKGTFANTGNISVSGSTGTRVTGASSYGGGASGGGFKGGNGRRIMPNNAVTSQKAEGTVGARSDGTTANGNGGGGGYCASSNYGGAGGGGGGHSAVGGNSAYGGAATGTGGTGGTVAGNSALTSMVFGGGGGGSANQDYDDHYAAGGSSGAGIILIFANEATLSGLLLSKGANGISNSSDRGGAGGSAGGSVLICSSIIDIGTNKISSIGGSGGYGNDGTTGGAGSKGRVAIYYGTSLTGSLSSTYYGTYTAEEDESLVEAVEGGAFLLNMI